MSLNAKLKWMRRYPEGEGEGFYRPGTWHMRRSALRRKRWRGNFLNRLGFFPSVGFDITHDHRVVEDGRRAEKRKIRAAIIESLTAGKAKAAVRVFKKLFKRDA